MTREELREMVRERAAIMEFDGEMPRYVAERLARDDVFEVERKRLAATSGKGRR